MSLLGVFTQNISFLLSHIFSFTFISWVQVRKSFTSSSANSLEHAHFVLGNTCGKVLQTVAINGFPIHWFLYYSPNSSLLCYNYMKSLLLCECKTSPIHSCVWKIRSNVNSTWKIMKPPAFGASVEKVNNAERQRARLWGYSLFTLFSDCGHSIQSCFIFLLQCLPDFHFFI